MEILKQVNATLLRVGACPPSTHREESYPGGVGASASASSPERPCEFPLASACYELVELLIHHRFACQAMQWCRQIQPQRFGPVLHWSGHATSRDRVSSSCRSSQPGCIEPDSLQGQSLCLLRHATQKMGVSPAKVSPISLSYENHLSMNNVCVSVCIYVCMCVYVNIQTSLKLSSRLMLVLSISRAVFSRGLSW